MINLIKIGLGLFSLALFIAFGSMAVFAQECTGTSCPTAIGDIQTTPSGLAQNIYYFGLGIGGGIAFLFIAAGAIKLLTSAGNPDALKSGWEMIGSAIAGLLFIAFSVLLLRTIGVNILHLPGFN